MVLSATGLWGSDRANGSGRVGRGCPDCCLGAAGCAGGYRPKAAAGNAAAAVEARAPVLVGIAVPGAAGFAAASGCCRVGDDTAAAPGLAGEIAAGHSAARIVAAAAAGGTVADDSIAGVLLQVQALGRGKSVLGLAGGLRTNANDCLDRGKNSDCCHDQSRIGCGQQKWVAAGTRHSQMAAEVNTRVPGHPRIQRRPEALPARKPIPDWDNNNSTHRLPDKNKTRWHTERCSRCRPAQDCSPIDSNRLRSPSVSWRRPRP